jgi:Glycosyl transferase family 2
VTVWAVGVVRDEADIIEATVTRMLREVDHVLIADNRSADGTAEILRSLDRVTVLIDPDPDFHGEDEQPRRTTALAALAGQRGARWVVPFDADEVWVAHDGRVGDVLGELPDDILLARAPWLTHVVTDRDPPGPDPVARMVYRRPRYDWMPKIACRPGPGLWIAKGNHHATYEGVARPRFVDGLVRVHHFPARSAEQFVRKIRYRADGAEPPPMDERRTWIRVLEEEGEAALMAKFHEKYCFADPEAAGLVLDPCP